jgi:hypothetical protein
VAGALLTRGLTVGLFSVAVAGCYSLSIASAPCSLKCASDGWCPSDWTCAADGFCHRSSGEAACNVGVAKLGGIQFDFQPSGTLNLPSGITGGSHVIVACSSNDGSSTVSVTDSIGDDYTLEADASMPSFGLRVFSASVPTGIGNWGSITVTLSGAQSVSWNCGVYEVIGLFASNYVDRVATDPSGANRVEASLTTAATTQADELVFGAFIHAPDTVVFTPGPGFALLDSVVGVSDTRVLDTEWKRVSSIAPQTVSGTVSAVTNVSIIAITLKVAVGG